MPPSVPYYTGIPAHADLGKNKFPALLLEANRVGRNVVAYGAAARGNTLINYFDLRSDLIPCVVDKGPRTSASYCREAGF